MDMAMAGVRELRVVLAKSRGHGSAPQPEQHKSAGI